MQVVNKYTIPLDDSLMWLPLRAEILFASFNNSHVSFVLWANVNTEELSKLEPRQIIIRRTNRPDYFPDYRYISTFYVKLWDSECHVFKINSDPVIDS